jgi:hypothetical protein
MSTQSQQSIPSSQKDTSRKSTDEIVNAKLDKIFPDLAIVDEDDLPKAQPVVIETTETVYEVAGYKMSKSQFKEQKSIWPYIGATIIIIIIFLIVWYLFYKYVWQENEATSDESQPTQTDTYDVNYGAILLASNYYKTSGRHKRKMKNKFQQIGIQKDEVCAYGYYGSECNLQSHDSSYYLSGKFNSEYTTQDVDGEIPLSFDINIEDGKPINNSCTGICNNTEGCNGVEYDHENMRCSLVMSDVVANGSSDVNFNKDKLLYLKNNISPHFTDKVVAYSGMKPQRYYLDRDEQKPSKSKKRTVGTSKNKKSGIIQMSPNVIYELDWIPYRIVNYGNMRGTWSINKNMSNPIYTDSNSGEYNLPLSLQNHKKLFVMYKLNK